MLPVYAYWHMDDFSWGETRKVDGSGGDDHGRTDGIFDASSIFMKRWYEFETERMKKAERYDLGQLDDHELKEKVTYYLNNPIERKKIAEAGRLRCLTSSYSNEARLGSVIEFIRRDSR